LWNIPMAFPIMKVFGNNRSEIQLTESPFSVKMP
jgi:hypothetical protein